MIAVIFEVFPAEDQIDQYFGTAADLKPLLADVDGFISVERFRSLADPAKYLSLSFFQDEDAVLKWRNSAAHRAAQARGRRHILSDYRLRVAHVVRDYGMTDRAEAPEDSRIVHATDEQ